MKKKIHRVIYEYNEQDMAIIDLLSVIRSYGGHVYNLSENSGGTFTDYAISKEKLTPEQIRKLKKKTGWI